MTWLRRFRFRLRALFRKGQMERELDDELRFHLDREVEQNIAAGISPEEARHCARCRFGGMEQIKEACRDVRGVNFTETLIQDLRYGLRMLRRSPAFTAVAVLSLALGIGANTALFSLIDAVLLKMLPVKNPEQLVVLAAAPAGKKPQASFSYPMFQDLRDRNSVFSGMFAYKVAPLSLSAGGMTERVLGELVSGNFFSVLGLNPFRGRFFSDKDDQAPGAHPVAVVSYNFWKGRLAEDPSWVGKTLHLNGYPFTVVGVAPPGFFGVEVGRAPDVWVPMMMQAQMMPGFSALANRRAWWLSIMARRKPGVSEQQAQAATDILFQQIDQGEAANPKSRFLLEQRIQLLPGSKGLSSLRERFSQPLLILMSMVGLILLIACANAANLLLARAAARQKEIAVRLTLGAGRLRLIRQLMTESVLLSLLGGLLGLILAFRGTAFLLSFLPHGFLPMALELHPDGRVLGFTLSLSLMSGMLFGLAPALQSTQSNLMPALKNEVSARVSGRRRLRLRKMLVITQVALSLVLLIGAGLFVRTLQNLKRVDAGFNPEKVLLFSMNPSLNSYNPDQVRSFYAYLIPQVQALPGVRSASLAYHPLLSGEFRRDSITIPSYQPRPQEDMSTLVNFIDPRFFETIGMSFRLGRDFGPQDHESAPKVAVINETVARDFFGHENPIGRRIGVGTNMADTEIIGVIRDTKYRNLREQAPRAVYLPFLQSRTPLAQRTLYVRTTIDPNRIIAAVRREVQALDKDLPVYNVMTMTQQVDESLVQERLVAQLSSAFGVLALLLACVGLYGIMAYAVIGRTHEIGIRMALGAGRGHVLWLILKDTLWLVGLGLGIGLPAALGLTRWVSSLLFGITATDPGIFVSVSLLLLAVALLASYLPARKATEVDPLVALRYE